MKCKQYRISEIADLAGVSKRTVDYYTTLGLLRPVRSESNYRYYTEEALIRLRMVHELKAKRLSLEEIREHFRLLDAVVTRIADPPAPPVEASEQLIVQVRQLERRLRQLQPVLVGLEQESGGDTARQIAVQSLTLIQALLLCLNEITTVL